MKTQGDPNEYGTLSPREREILTLAAQGLLDKEIARDLGISIHTLRTYWVRVRKKLSTTSRTGMVNRWVEMQVGESGLLEWTPFLRWEYDFNTGRIQKTEAIRSSYGGILSSTKSEPRVIDPDDFPDTAEKLISIIKASAKAAAWTNRVITKSGSRRVYAIGKGVWDEQGQLLKIIGLSFELEPIDSKTRLEGGGMWICNTERKSFFAESSVHSFLGIEGHNRIDSLYRLLSHAMPLGTQRLQTQIDQATAAGGGLLDDELELPPNESRSCRIQALTQPSEIGGVFELGQLFRFVEDGTPSEAALGN